ncbi:MAG: PP2C family protein-serine/threonine phosphatase [Anaerolineales bacterium]|nr:PP2C family protein-serine/threonine phosphatase [Anaerolineales bacterium]
MFDDWLTQETQKTFWLLLLLLLPAAVALVWLTAVQPAAGWWWGLLILALGGLSAALLLARLLHKKAASGQRHATALYQLEQLAQAILREPVENGDLPALLNRHVPHIFPKGWVEIRLLPDSVLYAQGESWIPLDNDQWESLLAREGFPWTVPGLPEAVESGFGKRALVIPIQGKQAENVGGIYLMRNGTDDVWEWETSAQSLAALVTADLLRAQQIEEALAAQAEAYEKEIYEQAYQTEMTAMMAEYEKVSQELAIAKKVQTTFLPADLPEIAGWQLAVTLEPAREMSGDFYDFIALPNGRIGLVIADVADKGMGAALYMALSRTLIRTFAPTFDTAPEQVLQAANQRVLSETSSDLFVTVFYAILDPASGLLTYCNAGHNPPFLYSANGGGMKTLTRTAIPVGVLPETVWEQGSVAMQPGDLLVMYTDGVTEAEDEFAVFFGEERLKAVATANLGRSVDIIESKVVTAVLDFVGDAPQFDDITLMLLARDG